MKIFLLFISTFLATCIFGQNVGIGTTAAYSPLTFNNNLGPKIALYGTAVNNYGFGIVGGTLQIHSDAAAADIAFGYGSSATFTEIMRMKGNGTLRFPPALAKKIIFYPGGTGDASVGVFPNELRFTSDNPNADITFGYDAHPSTFTERMRINGNGNVGIGAYPFYLLDVNGRMRIRSSGALTGTAGLWLNNMSNVEKVFFGMEDDTHVGFYSPASGWKFSMNTETGALKVNGSEGQAGQLLRSNGDAAPGWANNPVSEMYNLTEEISSTAIVTIPQDQSMDIPGLTKTFNLTKPSKVIVSFMIVGKSVGCSFCSYSTVILRIILDGNSTGYIWKNIVNGNIEHLTGTRIFNLAPGNHSIKINGWNLTAPNVDLGSTPGGPQVSIISIQVVPQN